MKKLSKHDLAEHTRLGGLLDTAKTELEAAVEEFNSSREAAWAKVEEAKSKLDSAIEEAKGWTEEKASAIDGYIGDRSDKWRDGDKGSAFDDWKQKFEDFDPDIDLDQPDELDMPDLDFVGEFQEIPPEPEC